MRVTSLLDRYQHTLSAKSGRVWDRCECSGWVSWQLTGPAGRTRRQETRLSGCCLSDTAGYRFTLLVLGHAPRHTGLPYHTLASHSTAQHNRIQRATCRAGRRPPLQLASRHC